MLDATEKKRDFFRQRSEITAENAVNLIERLAGRRDLDGHAHVFHLSDPMIENRRYTPGQDAPLSEWLSHLLANELKGGTLVQPSFLGTDNSRLLASMRQAQRDGWDVTGSVQVEGSCTVEDLVVLRQAGVVSVRLNMLGQQNPVLDRPLVERIIAAQLAIELHAPAKETMTIAPQIMARGGCLILDHYGLAESAETLKVLASLSHDGLLFVKASAPYRLPIADADQAEAVREFTIMLREELGENRLIYGSDWPHTQHPQILSFQSAFESVLQ
ncbi:amidohydrolase family protein [Pseudahrensia aquimaris]|uniref:Amidohydrolase family protein n=1 Tax=Pseudahrensia aquimaris TaxID=744461 RepID=A0ABW3FE52_9HYPH